MFDSSQNAPYQDIVNIALALPTACETGSPPVSYRTNGETPRWYIAHDKWLYVIADGAGRGCNGDAERVTVNGGF